MINNNLIEELLILSEVNESTFDLNSSILEAKEILENEMNSHALSDCHFEKMVWYIEERNHKTRPSLNFHSIRNTIQFNKEIETDEFIRIVKCWIAGFIGDGYSTSSILRYLSKLKDFLQITSGLTSKNIDAIAEDMKTFNDELGNLCKSVLNFFDYYDDFLFDIEEYVNLLNSLLTHSIFDSRSLPCSKDVLIFSKIVEDFFSQNLALDEYLRWFPIKLWWNLTMLIPLRPGEFCKIRRNCLEEENGTYYIRLPREKIKFNNNKRIQISDKILIPTKIYKDLENYITLTNKYGHTETLISYLSLSSVNSKRKYYKEWFTLSIFDILLRKFYKHVVFKMYKVALNEEDNDISNLSIQRCLRPGDTRHFAMINLNRQGYHPVEIARLAGHTRLSSQNHYYRHIENYIDLEILELVAKADLDSFIHKLELSNIEEIETQHSINQLGISFIEKYVLQLPTTEFKRKMKDGYCTDPLQRCPGLDCWDCDYWRITLKEFESKKEILAKKISESKQNLTDTIKNLQEVYKWILNSTKVDSSISIDEKKELLVKSRLIDNALQKYLNLNKIKERILKDG